MEIGPPLKASEVNETGWYYLDRPGPPRGYVYVGADPDNNLWVNTIQGNPIQLRSQFKGTFYKVPNCPVMDDDNLN